LPGATGDSCTPTLTRRATVSTAAGAVDHAPTRSHPSRVKLTLAAIEVPKRAIAGGGNLARRR
jgi:hypothetical protein